VGSAGKEGHGGFPNAGQNLAVACCIARGTSTAVNPRAGNFCLYVALLHVAERFYFCQNRRFVLFGWWVGG